MSLGTSPNPLIADTTKDLVTTRWKGIETDENGKTSREGVFAGGDAVTGAATVILAMGAGKAGAKGIHELLSNKYYELNKLYFGDDVIINDDIKYEWERIPHLYYDFYVYQYATGLSAACYIVKRILNHEENAVSDYLKFLSTGDSMDPIEELKVAGVDMEDEKVINGAIDMFQEIINEYRSLM